MSIFGHLLTAFGKILKKKKSVRKKRKKKTSRRPSAKKKTTKKKITKKKTAKKKTVKKKPAKKKPAKKKIPRKRKTVKAKPKSVRRVKVKKKSSVEGAGPADGGAGVLIGEVTHYFSKISVCVVKITKGNLRVGDQIRVKGKNSDFVQKVKSLQIESRDVRAAGKGQLVGLKADQVVKGGDKVYRL